MNGVEYNTSMFLMTAGVDAKEWIKSHLQDMSPAVAGMEDYESSTLVNRPYSAKFQSHKVYTCRETMLYHLGVYSQRSYIQQSTGIELFLYVEDLCENSGFPGGVKSEKAEKILSSLIGVKVSSAYAVSVKDTAKICMLVPFQYGASRLSSILLISNMLAVMSGLLDDDEYPSDLTQLRDRAIDLLDKMQEVSPHRLAKKSVILALTRIMTGVEGSDDFTWYINGPVSYYSNRQPGVLASDLRYFIQLLPDSNSKAKVVEALVTDLPKHSSISSYCVAVNHISDLFKKGVI